MKRLNVFLEGLFGSMGPIVICWADFEECIIYMRGRGLGRWFQKVLP